MVLHECPFCHKLMAAKEVEREEADSNELTTTMHSPNAGRMGLAGFSQMIGPYGTVLYDQSEVKRVLDNPSALIAYRVKYQCKNCGKHWTKIHVERRPLPGQYVEDEGEDEKAALDRESDELASEEA